jgi:hypothetical protein
MNWRKVLFQNIKQLIWIWFNIITNLQSISVFTIVSFTITEMNIWISFLTFFTTWNEIEFPLNLLFILISLQINQMLWNSNMIWTTHVRQWFPFELIFYLKLKNHNRCHLSTLPNQTVFRFIEFKGISWVLKLEQILVTLNSWLALLNMSFQVLRKHMHITQLSSDRWFSLSKNSAKLFYLLSECITVDWAGH